MVRVHLAMTKVGVFKVKKSPAGQEQSTFLGDDAAKA